MDFKSIDRALNFVQTWALKEMELAFAFTQLNTVKGVALDSSLLKFSED